MAVSDAALSMLYWMGQPPDRGWLRERSYAVIEWMTGASGTSRRRARLASCATRSRLSAETLLCSGRVAMLAVSATRTAWLARKIQA